MAAMAFPVNVGGMALDGVFDESSSLFTLTLGGRFHAREEGVGGREALLCALLTFRSAEK